MSFRFFRFLVIMLAVAGLVAHSLLPTGVQAQKGKTVFWDAPPVKIRRVAKPDRKPARPIPKIQSAQPLTLQWHLLKRVDESAAQEVDPSTEFVTGDRVRLAIMANQDGYLYIINQPEGRDGVALFPDPHVNGGRNLVKKNEEYLVPNYCDNVPDPKDCWMKMAPPAGRETFIVIFSRDKITTLPDEVVKANGVVKASVIEQLKSDSRQQVVKMTGELSSPGRETVRYATRVQNTNLKDNEELITTIEISHKD